MNIEKLFEILEIVNGVHSNKWSDVIKIVPLMPSIKIEAKKWSDTYKQENPKWYPLDLSKIETWSTYGGECVDLMFSNKSNKLYCNVKIYNGDPFGGFRKGLRFSATLIMPTNFIKEIEDKLVYALNRLASNSYDEYLENQREIWIADFKNKIINQIKN